MTRTGYGETEEAGETGDAPESAAGPGGSSPPPDGPVCELCGARMMDRHCKIVCLNCGYQRDCSDP